MIKRTNKKLLLLSLCISFLSYQIQSTNVNANIYSYNYDLQYKDIAKSLNQEVAVVLTAFNRPEYFKECIKSIEQNPESQELIFIFALDGGPKAKQDMNVKIIQNSSIKHKIILLRNRNYGCPKNHIDSKRFAFEWCNFKKLIIMEEDVRVSPHYFTFLLNFRQWATEKFTNVGAVQAWSKCYLPIHEKAKQLNFVRENPDYWSFVTYCIDEISWNKIRNILYKFEDFVDQIPHAAEYDKVRSKPYMWRDAHKIQEWVQMLVKLKIKKSTSIISKLSLVNEFLSTKFKANQDVMMGFAFYMNDLVKLQTVVNRVIHIGEHGISTNKETYNSIFKPIKLDIFEKDRNLFNFNLV